MKKYVLLASVICSAGLLYYYAHRGTDINAHGQGLNTQLHFAALRGQHDVVQDLVNRGAQTNVENREKNTPLHYAADHEIAQILLDHGAAVDAVNIDGRTPLHMAAMKGDTQTALLILEYAQLQNKEKSLRSHRDNQGDTAADLAELAGYHKLATNLK